MTTYRSYTMANMDHGGEIITLKREAVQHALTSSEADARRYADRGPTSAEWDMGWNASDVQEAHSSAVSEIKRLTAVLAHVDAGTPELPRALYPR